MNIKFEEIIARANARKEALQNFQEHLQTLPEAIEMFDAALEYFEKLSELSRSLDAEAKDLTGKTAGLAQLVGQACADSRRALFTGTSFNVSKLLITLSVEAFK
jgi:benzoyl-CoA reductase/2-hydroxyglutaryl-CoA dehydratase subunit BcrC/BadD/HgdB